ncbi:MAG: relaxase domain-containing protein [Actinomycetota bacterium]|nr:relaxase domain-containing protein [Actinomycetota bacterium]
MLSIGKLRPGGGEYYVREIASSAEDYYLGHGEAPGRWVGSLADEMGLHGEVDPDHFRALLDGRHPLTGEQLVDPPRAKTRHVSTRPGDEWLTAEEAAAQLGVTATFVRRLLRTGKLEGEKARAETTGRATWRVQRAHVNAYAAEHKPPKRRPGFDHTLRPPKSVSVLWALADPDRRAAIRQAHRKAVDEVVRYYEDQVIIARHRGERIQTAGLVAAAFDHRSSRAGDPLLHTHVVVTNLTLTVADNWRCLDARPLFDHSLSGGYLYQAHLRHLLTDRLGVEWGPVIEGMADVAGVPQAVIDEFSQRRDEIEDLLAESGYTSARARQKATLATRRPKDRTVDPDTLATAWRDRAAALGFDGRAVEACFGRAKVQKRSTRDIERLYDHLAGPHGLTERASTFTRRDLVRDIAAAIGASAPAVEVERLADRFLASHRVVVLAGPTSGRNSQIVVGLDNRRIRTGGTAVFSTPELIEIETRLLRWAAEPATPAASPTAIDSVLALQPDLRDEQAAMVRAVCSPSARIQPVVGRPGSGKTYAASACVQAFAVSGVPVVGCAVSATAAAELEFSVGLAHHSGRPAQTMASLLIDLEQRGDRLADGTVVLVDEASMVGTRDLARLAAHVQAADGCIKLIGDPDQHTAVDTGGVFKALAARIDPTVVRLVDNRRQRDHTERAAIDDYRHGDIAAALDRYDSAGKVHRGDTAADTYDALVRDWWADRCAGSASPMLAGTNAARRALNDCARALLKSEGILSGEPLVAHRRELLIGDEVVARRNDRSLHTPGGREFVKNGSVGRVVAIDHEHREVDVAFEHEGVVRIPTTYLAAGHLEHAYARTTYGVQGATLDRARYHPSDASRFEEGYVAITRATDATNLYVVDGDLGLDDEDDPRAIEPDRSGLGTVIGALERRSDQQLAVETDPRAIEAAALAQAHTLKELTEQSRRLDAVLSAQPPSVADEIEREEQRLASARTRLDAMHHAKPGWKPSARRQFTEKLASTERTIARHEDRLAELRAQQDAHDAFAVEHAAAFEQARVLGLATSARRLTVRITAVAEPPQAALDLVGRRPTTQRERLPWDRAVESLAVYLDESGRPWPDRAETVRDVIGPQPEHFVDRYEHERIAKAVYEVHAPARDIGRSLGIR